jgi:hypothetical protein
VSHALDRAHERYGLSLTRADLSDMERAIERGSVTAVYLEPGNGKSEIWAVRHAGRWLVMAWEGRNITTFLPMHKLDPHHKQLRRELAIVIRAGLEKNPRQAL